MPLQFELEFEGDVLVRRRLLDMGARSLDVREPLRAIRTDLRLYEAERFDTEGDGTWAELKPSTIAQKAREHKDPRILHATLRLRDSLTKPGAPGAFSRITPQFMLFGTTVPYAKYHQRGAFYPQRKTNQHMPARKPLGFTEIQKRGMIKRLQRHVVDNR